MKNSNVLKTAQMVVLNCILMSGCSSLPRSQRTSTLSLAGSKVETVIAAGAGPAIGFPADLAFFPLKIQDGKVVGVYYSWRQCVKKFIFKCVKWERQEVVYKWDDQEMMTWFKANDFGFKKRPSP
jgi:hypothetical protein